MAVKIKNTRQDYYLALHFVRQNVKQGDSLNLHGCFTFCKTKCEGNIQYHSAKYKKIYDFSLNLLR